MGHAIQKEETHSREPARSRERIDRREEEAEADNADGEADNHGFAQSGGETIHRSAEAATVASASGGPGSGATPGTVNYDPGPDVHRLSEEYGIDFCKDGQAEKVQRLEQDFGSDRVQRWADEGMTVDTMGKPRDMRAYRERKANRSEEIPDDIERQNQASYQRNVYREEEEGPAGDAEAPDVVRNVISKPGRSLDGDVQREMESKMGGDFSDVQVHTGPEAAVAADSINARAFTVGNHVAFNDGEYNPGSNSGKKILAHELTHVRQQTDGRVSMLPAGADEFGRSRRSSDDFHVQAKLEVSSPDDPQEKEAEAVAEAVTKMDSSMKVESDVGPGSKAREEDNSGMDGGVLPGLSPSQPLVQPNAATGGSVDGETEKTVKAGISGSGKSLPSDTRAEFESKMGADFSDVSIHTDSQANEAAASINAEAYTVGSNIAFANGAYDTSSVSGQQLLAHELTHVRQQHNGMYRSQVVNRSMGATFHPEFSQVEDVAEDTEEARLAVEEFGSIEDAAYALKEYGSLEEARNVMDNIDVVQVLDAESGEYVPVEYYDARDLSSRVQYQIKTGNYLILDRLMDRFEIFERNNPRFMYQFEKGSAILSGRLRRPDTDPGEEALKEFENALEYAEIDFIPQGEVKVINLQAAQSSWEDATDMAEPVIEDIREYLDAVITGADRMITGLRFTRDASFFTVGALGTGGASSVPKAMAIAGGASFAGDIAKFPDVWADPTESFDPKEMVFDAFKDAVVAAFVEGISGPLRKKLRAIGGVDPEHGVVKGITEAYEGISVDAAKELVWRCAIEMVGDLTEDFIERLLNGAGSAFLEAIYNGGEISWEEIQDAFAEEFLDYDPVKVVLKQRADAAIGMLGDSLPPTPTEKAIDEAFDEIDFSDLSEPIT